MMMMFIDVYTTNFVCLIYEYFFNIIRMCAVVSSLWKANITFPPRPPIYYSSAISVCATVYLLNYSGYMAIFYNVHLSF